MLQQNVSNTYIAIILLCKHAHFGTTVDGKKSGCGINYLSTGDRRISSINSSMCLARRWVKIPCEWVTRPVKSSNHRPNNKSTKMSILTLQTLFFVISVCSHSMVEILVHQGFKSRWQAQLITMVLVYIIHRPVWIAIAFLGTLIAMYCQAVGETPSPTPCWSSGEWWTRWEDGSFIWVLNQK